MSEIYEYLKDSIPRNHYRQSSAHSILRERAAAGLQATRILDFGCGDGRTIDLFREVMPEAEWTGVDIASSPEVDLRRRSDGHFVTYDGHDLPFHGGFLHGVWIIGSKEIAPFQTFSCLHSPAKTRFRMAGE